MARKRVKVEQEEDGEEGREGENSSRNVKREDSEDNEEDVKPSRASKRRKLETGSVGPNTVTARTAASTSTSTTGRATSKGKGRETTTTPSSSQTRASTRATSTAQRSRGTSTTSRSLMSRPSVASSRQRRITAPTTDTGDSVLSSVTNRDVKPDISNIKQEEEEEEEPEDNAMDDNDNDNEEAIDTPKVKVEPDHDTSSPSHPSSSISPARTRTARHIRFGTASSPHSSSTLRQDSEAAAHRLYDAQYAEYDREVIRQAELNHEEENDSPSGTSTLSALSEENTAAVPLTTTATTTSAPYVNVRQVKLEESDKENNNPESEPEEGGGKLKKKLTKKQKGKQRAANQDDPGDDEEDDENEGARNKHNAQHVKKLEEELKKLRAELENKSATLESQTNAMNRVSEAFTCNVCLEALRNPLALACGHIFCQDDLWNWFHRTDADSGDDDLHDDDGLSDDSLSYDSDDSIYSDTGFARRPSTTRYERIAAAVEAAEARAAAAVAAAPPTRNNNSSTNNEYQRRRNAEDLFPISGDDMNTDDSLDETDSGIEDNVPVRRNDWTAMAIKGTRSRPGPPAAAGGGNDDRGFGFDFLSADGRPLVAAGGLPLANTSASAQRVIRPYRRSAPGGPSPPQRRRAYAAAPAARAGDTRNIGRQPAQSGSGSDAAPAAVATTSVAAAGPALREADPPAQGRAPAEMPAAEATPAAATTSRRIPARRHPNKRNLVCPQCRTKVSIPPFPIFMIREVNDLVNVHAHGRRVGSVEREREQDGMVEDVTWGGLFPRAAAAGTNAGRNAPPAPAPMPPLNPYRPRFPTARLGVADIRNLSEGTEDLNGQARAGPSNTNRSAEIQRSVDVIRRLSSSGDEQSEPTRATRDRYGRSLASIANARSGREGADHGLGHIPGEVVPRRPSTSSESDSVMDEIIRRGRDYADYAATGPSTRDGQARRQEAEHEAVIERMQERELGWLERNAANRRRALRAENSRGRPSTREDEEDEVRLRAAEDRAINDLRRNVENTRRNRPRSLANNAANARGPRRDILRRGIWDAEDRVRRCVDCNWEIERGTCQHCGVTYDSDSEFDEDDEEDETVAATTSPARERAWPGDSQIDDIIDDEEASVKAESEGEYNEDPTSDRVKHESEEDETGDDELAQSLFPVRERPTGGRLHPFSSEEPEDEDEGEEDLVADVYDDPEDAEDRRRNREVEGDDEEEDEAEEEEDIKPSRRAREAAVIQRRTKKSRYMYDSHDEEEDEMEDEEDDGFFVNDSRVKAEEEEINNGERDILDDDESEAESTDRETKRARREQRRQAREAQALTALGNGKRRRESTSDFSDEDSESSEEEDEDESAPTSHTSPGGVKKEEDEHEDLPTISSQVVREDIRDQLARNEGRSTARDNAARAAIARNSAAPAGVSAATAAQNKAMQAQFEAMVAGEEKKAEAKYKRTQLAQAQAATAGPSRLAIEQAPGPSKRRRVIKESSDEE